MRRERFVNDNFFHVYNRGVEKRHIFVDDADRGRFAAYLYFLNDQNFYSENFIRLGLDLANVQGFALNKEEKKREPFVNIVSWCLMPNHFHLLLQQRIDGGVSKFMQKLGTAYTMYFNKRRERSGVLFQGVFKSRPVAEEIYLTHVSRYIHLNSLELRYKNWEEHGVRDADAALAFLREYRWSSLPTYLGASERKKSFDKIISTAVLLHFFDSQPKEYKRFLAEWIQKGVGDLHRSSDNLFKAKP